MTILPNLNTEGIKYVGSKLRLIPYIYDIIKELPVVNVLDGFSGTTRVSQMLANNGYKVFSNDISEWSNVFAKAYLLHNNTLKYYNDLLDHLNQIKGYKGWFTEHYGGDENSKGKKPFQIKNTMKLDGIRDEIDNLNLSDIDKSVALTSLILAMDCVDNTLGHYCSYLSGWSKRSYNNIELKIPKLCSKSRKHIVYKEDIFNIINKNYYDLVYFDPPYGSNNDKMPSSRVRYNSYYHIWTSIILNDKPSVFGNANRRMDTKDGLADSVFEDYRKNNDGNFFVLDSIKSLIHNTNAHYILLSYSSSGRVTKDDLLLILNKEGKLLQNKEIDYRTNVMGVQRWTNEWINSTNRTNEYLFLLEK